MLPEDPRCWHQMMAPEGRKTATRCWHQMMAPPRQATEPPRQGAGVGVGMLRGIQTFSRKGHQLIEDNELAESKIN